MLNSLRLNKLFSFFPRFSLGKFWSFWKVNEPVRPIALNMRDKPVAFISRFEGDHGGRLGIVFSSKDGQKLIFLETEKTWNVLDDNTYYLTIPPMEYLETATRLKHSPKEGTPFYGLYADVESLLNGQTKVSPADKAWVEYCLEPDKTSAPSAPKSTLGYPSQTQAPAPPYSHPTTPS